MSVVTTIPREKAKAFVRKLTKALCGHHDIGTIDMIGSLNRQPAGWAAFYKFTNFTARIFRRETRHTVTSRYHDVAMAMGQA